MFSQSAKYLCDRIRYDFALGLGGDPIDWSDEKERLIKRVSDRLAPFDMKHKSGMEWYSAEADAYGFRRLFLIHEAGVGRPLTANWGYGFDFVPRIEGERVITIPSFSNASRDLWFVPLREMPRAHRALGKRTFEAAIPYVLSHGIRRAQRFWSQGHTLEDVSDLLVCASWDEFKIAQSFDGYRAWRSALSLPFLMARLGEQSARDRLEEALVQMSLPDVVCTDLTAALRSLQSSGPVSPR